MLSCVKMGKRLEFAAESAINAAGLPLSGWIRERLRRAARKELEDMDMPVAFLDRLSA